MAECHQCKTTDMDDEREGDCGICFATGVKFCKTCAMWELGPKPADDVELFAALATASQPLRVSVSRLHSQERSSSTSSIATMPLECDAFFPAIEAVCPYIANQLDTKITVNPPKLYGQSFKTYACGVLDKFRELYPTCKYNRVAIQILLIMHLSGQERVQCRQAADGEADSHLAEVKYLKRWQTRELAVAHLRQHLTGIGVRFGTTVKDLVSKPTWQAALGLDDFEFFMKGFKPPTLLAVDLLARAGGDVGKAREILEIALILYHSLTAARDKGSLERHWSQTRNDFLPNDCLGMLSKAHYESLYGTATDGTLSEATVARLEDLWAALADDDLPAHPRFPDTDVPTTLAQVEREYLQYLPTFDHPHAERDDRCECEKVVRKRVVATLERYREAYASKVHRRRVKVKLVENGSAGGIATTRTISIEATNLARVDLLFDKKLKPNGSKESHVRTDFSDDAQRKFNAFLTTFQSLAYLERLPPEGCEIKVSYATGNDRRNTRRDLVLGPIKALLSDGEGGKVYEYSSDPEVIAADGTLVDDWDVEAFTDRVIAHMQDDLYVDQCFDAGLADLLLTTTWVTPQAWFPLKLKAKPYAEVFPACNFADEQLYVLDEHYAPITGTSARPSHYVDWRNHKDNWLYDCFAIDPRRRPLFCSLSMQPLVPEINGNYGHHTLVFDRGRTRHRSVHTFGDKQQPRRSMLLLLDDLLYARAKKEGSAGQSADSRRGVVDSLFIRLDHLRIFGGLTIEEQWELALSRPYHRYPDGDLLIECQIFGGVDKANDVLAMITIVEADAWMNDYLPNETWIQPTGVTAAQHHLSTHLGAATLLGYRPFLQDPQMLQRKSFPTIAEADARKDLLDQNAADHATP